MRPQIKYVRDQNGNKLTVPLVPSQIQPKEQKMNQKKIQILEKKLRIKYKGYHNGRSKGFHYFESNNQYKKLCIVDVSFNEIRIKTDGFSIKDLAILIQNFEPLQLKFMKEFGAKYKESYQKGFRDGILSTKPKEGSNG